MSRRASSSLISSPLLAASSSSSKEESSPLTRTVRIHLTDPDFRHRLSAMDAYVVPLLDAAQAEDGEEEQEQDTDGKQHSYINAGGAVVHDTFPRAQLVSLSVPVSCTSHADVSSVSADNSHTRQVPVSKPASAAKPNSIVAAPQVKPALLAWRCPLCGTRETEQLLWLDGPASSSSSSSATTRPHTSTTSASVSVTDRHQAKRESRKRMKAQLRRRSLAVSPLCAQCQLCPRCGGGAGIGAKLERDAQVSTLGIPTVGLQTRMTPSMRYDAVCGYCQWGSYRSFQDMTALAQYMKTLSPEQNYVLRTWRRARREVMDLLHGARGQSRLHGGTSSELVVTEGLSYSQQAWEQFLRIERERRRVAMEARRPPTAAGAHADPSDPLEGTETREEDVYASSVRQAGSTHRAVVLDALRSACRNVHEATHYNPKTETDVLACQRSSGAVPSFVKSAPVATLVDSLRTRHTDAERTLKASSSSPPPKHVAEACLVAHTQGVQHGLDQNFVQRPHFTAETVAALLRPDISAMTGTRSHASPSALPQGPQAQACSSGAAHSTGAPAAGSLSPSRTGRSLACPSVQTAKTEPSMGSNALSGPQSRLDALPPPLEAFLAEQAKLEAAQHDCLSKGGGGDRGNASKPWLPSLLAYFVAAPHKSPVTALSFEQTLRLGRLGDMTPIVTASTSAASSQSLRVRLVCLLGVSALAEPSIAEVVCHWASLLSARASGQGTRTNEGGKDGGNVPGQEEDDENDENENEVPRGGKASPAVPLATHAMILARASQSTRRAVPLLLPLQRSAFCLLPHLRYLNTTCAFTPGPAGNRRVVHQLHFHLVNLSTEAILIQHISLARCGGLPVGSQVGLWTTADTAAAHEDTSEDDALEVCAYLTDEVRLRETGSWVPTAASPTRTPAHATTETTTVKGWCRLVPHAPLDRGEQTDRVDEAREARAVPDMASVFRRVTGYGAARPHTAAPQLNTTAPRLASLPLVFSLSTPVPADGSLNAFTAATTGPPPCFLAVRVQALVYLPPPYLPEAAERVWRTHVPPEERAKVSGYHEITFGLSVCT